MRSLKRSRVTLLLGFVASLGWFLVSCAELFAPGFVAKALAVVSAAFGVYMFRGIVRTPFVVGDDHVILRGFGPDEKISRSEIVGVSWVSHVNMAGVEVAAPALVLGDADHSLVEIDALARMVLTRRDDHVVRWQAMEIGRLLHVDYIP